ncbi:alkaline phosphatase synthesis transcriptional regulatory protein PhoP [Halolactibacillus alkaliphilus]|uniref:Alkaline phosphatase synthesis transcriptional regulatory protein PhoP n=1 Tax=Halolactibacillus alkaliphilus TaxID=442899 RepID=A0A511X323_9BACI|nr:response regulator transcription factor [Halolactibacillus alkaliphilus]GEN57321.1 alkaline phosphatase synthesis transcriptional regulatory protein PhoP [Halolactibacillus alkaliphilus]GGN72861.1 alkaline phosphatase synthesis transcriptional regulatory protein PhoP [Halolactibacillus alkaliphilus]SFO93294.1 two-component system, OmpR family, alkaline phosphatase synthesis response regulator PhoP [Halolactibacillus alkaliphilus]
MSKKILIVDDEESIVTLLQYHIEKAGFKTDVAYSGTEALAKAMKHDYELIVLDLMLPGMEGTEVTKALRREKIDSPILMLTAKDDEFDKILGLELGADDYLTKPFSPKEVVARIKAILRRTNKPKEEESVYLSLGNLTIYPEQYEAMLEGEPLTFTRKEFELLFYLAKHKGKVLSRDQLLTAVWNYDFAGDTRIVDVHISHLREKIEPDTKQPIYIKTVRGLGYKMEEPKI